jgi:hypothetical protein
MKLMQKYLKNSPKLKLSQPQQRSSKGALERDETIGNDEHLMRLVKIKQEKQLVDNLILSKSKSSNSLITAKISENRDLDFMRQQKGTQIKNPLLGG